MGPYMERSGQLRLACLGARARLAQRAVGQSENGQRAACAGGGRIGWQCALLLVVVESALLLGGCGGEVRGRSEDNPTLAPPFVRESGLEQSALDAMRGMWHTPIWPKENRATRDAVWELRGDKKGVLRLSEKEALRLCRSVDVVLVGDKHGEELCRTALCRLIDLLAPNDSGPAAVAIEALKMNYQSDLDRALLHRDTHALEAMLQLSWPYPLCQYPTMIPAMSALGLEVLAAGPPTLGKHIPYLPPPSTPDLERRPTVAPDAERRELFRLEDKANLLAAERIHTWLSEHTRGSQPRPRVFVLYGGAHLQGYPDSIRSRLEELGRSVIVLLPLNADLELAIRETLGVASGGEWIQLAPGFLRPALIKDSEWLEAAVRDAERVASLRRLRASRRR